MKCTFISDELHLRTSQDPDRIWDVIKSVRFDFDDGFIHTIKATPDAPFPTDLNSGHWLPEKWHQRSRHAAALHDDLYRQGNTTRKYADQVFEAVQIFRKQNPRIAGMMYKWLRIGGWYSWNQHRKGQIRQ